RVGETVTFVVNRNINFTNVCMVRCGFCAFSRPPNASDAYLLKPEAVAERAAEAWKAGATEVCLHGGIHPEIGLEYYVDVLRAVKARVPAIHTHAYSPMEVYYAAEKAGVSVEEALKALREAGLDSMPGTAAEILDDEVRAVLCPRKLNVERWVEVVKTAHRLGIPTTSTMMYGHVDSARHRAQHLNLLRNLQKQTGGFTEFVPLSFIHPQAPIYLKGLARPGATGIEDLKLHAVARLMLQGWIDNIQASWVKLGPKLAQAALYAGANDLGGTLMEENISRAAGATVGQHLPSEELIRLIREAGRTPAQRTTTYQIIKVYS
ncbi:MAG: 7,8-didemethyl-8-hydroxy-5-deazariboflavin synthase subunit CofH, partial [Candidatus Hecatellales archaeon]